MRSGEAGLMKKSWAPACMALTTVSMPPEAVSTTTGVRMPAARISLQRVDARLSGHDQVEDNRVDAGILRQALVGLAAVFGMQDGKAFALQHGLDQAALRRIVIADQDRLGHVVHPSRSETVPMRGTRLVLRQV